MTWECKPGCSECCGLITFPESLVKNRMDLMQVRPIETHVILGVGFEHQIFMITQDYKCVFLNRKTNHCAIYRERPRVCKLFGTSPELLCPHLDMSGKIRTAKRSSQVRKYMDMMTQKKLNKAKDEGKKQ